MPDPTSHHVNKILSYASIVALACLVVTGVAISMDAEQRLDANETNHPNKIEMNENSILQLPPLFPLTTRDYIGYVCAITGLIIAAGGGIGGGGILVPTYILIMELPVKHAISLTCVTVLGGSMANNLLNANKKHPDHPHRSCIDWDLILLLEPMTILGTLVGANLNNFLPPMVLVVLLLLLLSLTAYKTLQQGISMYKEESQALLKEENREQHQRLVAVESKNDTKPPYIYGSVETTTFKSGDPSILSRQQTVALNDEKQQYRQVWQNIFKLTLLFAGITLLNVIKGDPDRAGGEVTLCGVHKCGAHCFWYLEAVMLASIAAFAFIVRRNLLMRLDAGVAIMSDIDWNEDNTVRYPIYAIVAGLVAGMFGIGGGIVKGPLMLALGVHPAVASATSACMILFTTATATISFAIFGLLIHDYAIAGFLVGFVATTVGQTVMTVLMERYQRNSYIIFSIGIVVALSAVCMSVDSVLEILAERRPD